MRVGAAFFCVITLLITGCGSPYRTPDLGGLYNNLIQNESPYRNPVILIPGLLGSHLIERDSKEVAWGAFGIKRTNPDSEEGARRIALPMQMGKTLRALRDNVIPAGALDKVVVSFLGYPIEQKTYSYILRVLGVGGYRDQDVGESGRIEYGDRHYTCFQFDYDWRRDIVESARNLYGFIIEKKRYVQGEVEKRYGIKNIDVKFDIVAHSMGGLVARYFLRYGTADLPDDGSLPEITWAGARYVENLVMIGTPNSGSLDALGNLVDGYRPALFLPRYSPALLGTMPAIYELLPRNRHKPVKDNRGHPVDILSPELWQKNKWGLANPAQDKVLKMLLPWITDPAVRRKIALEHQKKCLIRATQFFNAIDIPAKPPASLKTLLVAGDSEKTIKEAKIDSTGHLKITAHGPGDGTVLRSSALGDERIDENKSARLVSPIHWDQVLFLFSDHLNLTKNPMFTDNLLYFLLENPQ
jgi:pimeloyl-ACP methyl ester carboxylesterase